MGSTVCMNFSELEPAGILWHGWVVRHWNLYLSYRELIWMYPAHNFTDCFVLLLILSKTEHNKFWHSLPYCCCLFHLHCSHSCSSCFLSCHSYFLLISGHSFWSCSHHCQCCICFCSFCRNFSRGFCCRSSSCSFHSSQCFSSSSQASIFAANVETAYVILQTLFPLLLP